ncbi:MAG: peptidase T [Desulfobacteraceae bacterium]|nr:MAG: peptidase T [Desulfobacteraceae bacterium]
MNYPTLLERFLTYVKIDTQSSYDSDSFPTTLKQLDLARVLVQELKGLGLQEVELNRWGYVLATLETNQKHPVPTVALLAHMDTSPDVSGAGVNPQIYRDYCGTDLTLPSSLVIQAREHPELKEKTGKTIITSDGTTLLGADDKAGIAAIMDALTFLVQNPDRPRPRVRVVFTPDEEVGKGVDHLSLEDIRADLGYTLDGEKLGEIEDETFCADTVEIKIFGINTHPGAAKNKMVNAVKIVAGLLDQLPHDSLSPETTEKKEGYIHPLSLNGNIQTAHLKIVIRDFEENGLREKEEYLQKLLDATLTRYPKARADFKVTPSYRNMKVVLDRHPLVLQKAEQAVAKAGLTPKRTFIRGGTDGARLCFMGLPTPNLFMGGGAFHSKSEWVALEDMQKASEVVVHLLGLWAKEAVE